MSPPGCVNAVSRGAGPSTKRRCDMPCSGSRMARPRATAHHVRARRSHGLRRVTTSWNAAIQCLAAKPAAVETPSANARPKVAAVVWTATIPWTPTTHGRWRPPGAATIACPFRGCGSPTQRATPWGATTPWAAGDVMGCGAPMTGGPPRRRGEFRRRSRAHNARPDLHGSPAHVDHNDGLSWRRPSGQETVPLEGAAHH